MNTHELDSLKARLVDLRLYGILNELQSGKIDNEKNNLILQLVNSEEQERRLRLVQARVKSTRLKDLDPFNGFDWNWPKKIDRNQITNLFNFDFMNERSNVVFLGPAGVGKTMIAKNLVHEAAKRGQTAIFIEAVDLLEELIENSNRTGIAKTLEKFAKPQLLAIDEVGYLSYDSRHADLLLRVIHMRHRKASTIITTNRTFGEWRDMFPNAASVTALVDRLTESCDVVQIEGDSYRAHLAKLRMAKKKKNSK